MYTPEVQMQITLWRQQAAEGTLTQDELRKAILVLRETRMTAAQSTPQSKRAKAKIEIPSADDLLARLGD